MLSTLRHRRPKTWFSIVGVMLPLVAGWVDGVGVVQLGFFTSHMTGNTARLGGELGAHQWSAAAPFLVGLFAFVTGAAASAILTELSQRRSRGRYSAAFGLEAVTLTLAAWVLRPHGAVPPAALVFGLMCFAMGVQNGVTSRINGLVVRTTHITGVVTDIGLAVGRSLIRADRQADQPSSGALHGVIFAAFLLGCAMGGEGGRRFGWHATLFPAMLVLGFSLVDAFALLDRKVSVHPA